MSGIAHGFYRLLWRQPWLSLGRKKGIYKKLCAFGEVPDLPFNKDFFGLRYEGNLNNSIEFNIYYYDAFEKPLLFFLRDTLASIAPGDAASCFCDVGANIGQHSLFMSRHAGVVHAFEPFATVHRRLEYHIRLNDIDNIVLHKVGLGEFTEQRPFYAPTGRNQGIGSFDQDSVSKGNEETGQLDLVRGDEYFQSRGIARIDLLKIDVEGFEKPVLNGLRQTLERLRPVIVCEISYGKALGFASREELLRSLPPDYRLLCFDTRKADGSKARRRGARARQSGAYRVIPFGNWLDRGQDDLIACPAEKEALIPRRNRPA